MDERPLSDGEANALNDRMAAEIAHRRRELPNHRQEGPDRRRRVRPLKVERRMICAYCFERGDHPTAAHCLRALERPSASAPRWFERTVRLPQT